LIADRWPATIKIGVPTILLAYTMGTLLGLIAALRQNSWLDYLVTTVGTFGLAIPNWVIATWLILIFSIRFDLLPSGELHGWKHYIMPVVAYALTPMALVARYTRVCLLETMRSDFVRTARAKGLRERRVIVLHIARNALIPWVTVLLPEIPNILTGSIFIESIFRIPGIGSYFASSALARDYPLILALTLLIVVLWGFTYLITDLLYTVLDPRIRLVGSRSGG
jgi:ABC-type dipeptide/oligopeptide/nickel transport system permease component